MLLFYVLRKSNQSPLYSVLNPYDFVSTDNFELLCVSYLTSDTCGILPNWDLTIILEEFFLVLYQSESLIGNSQSLSINIRSSDADSTTRRKLLNERQESRCSNLYSQRRWIDIQKMSLFPDMFF